MATIYSLSSDGLIWYVGSTTNVEKRKWKHLNKADKGIGADLIPLEYSYEFNVLEKCIVEDRYIRERYYYETLMPLLCQKCPGRGKLESQRYYQKRIGKTGNEWNKQNRERCNEALKRWRERKKQLLLTTSRS